MIGEDATPTGVVGVLFILTLCFIYFYFSDKKEKKLKARDKEIDSLINFIEREGLEDRFALWCRIIEVRRQIMKLSKPARDAPLYLISERSMKEIAENETKIKLLEDELSTLEKKWNL